MAFSLTKFIKGLRITQENTLTPAAINITPAGSASTTTTVVSSQTADRTVTLPDLSGTVLLNSSVINALQIGAGAVDNTEFGYLDGVTSPIQSQLNTIAGSAITALTGDVVATGPGSVAATIQTNAVTTGKINAAAVTDAKVASGIDAIKLADGSVSNSEFQYLDGVTSAIQTQLNSKESAITTLPIAKGGTNSSTALTGNKAIISNGTQIVESTVTSTEVGNLAGTTSAIQTQLNEKVSFAGVEVLTNKDIDGGTASNTSRITLPKAPKTTLDALTRKAGTILFDTTTNKPYYDDGLQLQLVGSGSSSGAKNYIANPDFESGNVNSWSLGTVGTLTNSIPTGTPTFGSGASGNLSISATASGVIAGTESMAVQSTAATTVGNMIATSAMAIDAADQAKILTFQFYYSFPSGASSVDASGTSLNSFGVACYDVTNSAFLPVVGNFSMTQKTGVGIATGTMQTNANTASLRFIIYNANATTAAVTMNMDQFYLGPQTSPIGAVITDWQSYTPTFTGMGTVSNINVIYRRVGANIEIKGDFVTGSTTASTPYIYLPIGLLTSSTLFNPNQVGVAITDVPGATSLYILTTLSSLRLQISAQNATYSGIQNPGANAILGNVSHVSFNASVPIAGWSSNVQMSNDTDTRVVAARIACNAGFAINTLPSILPFNVVTYDTHAGVSASTYLVPVSGIYKVSAFLTTIAYTLGATAEVNLFLYKNLAQYSCLSRTIGNGNFVNWSTGGNDEIKCVAGDVLAIYAVAFNGATNVYADPIYTYATIERLSGPAVIASSEAVAISYGLTTSQSVGANSLIKYDTKLVDTHNAYSTTTGLFTAPISGNYRISCIGYSGSTVLYCVAPGVSVYLTSISPSLVSSGSVIIPMNAGNTVGILVVAAATPAGNSGGYLNSLSIERLK